ncbi:DUF4232 domain-containing protein [Streptomyces sp. NPDC059166]|uniref:DUF4232 domain-containing protein n=1 Tax=Streptomyces sp. NPDC059166 TaxID=3346752 RepID=UPI0036B7D95F
MRNLRFRHAAHTSALGAAALLTALSLTACQGGGQEAADSAGETAAATGTSAAPAAASNGKAEDGASTRPGTDDSASGPSKGSGSARKPAAEPASQQGGDSGDDAAPADDRSVTRPCDGSNSQVKLTNAPRPVNHMLLTVTNTGSEACDAYHYPFVRFGEAQSTPPVFEQSKPQAVVTLLPGESAYAGVLTSSADGSGTGGYSTKKATVHFQGREGAGSTGPSADASLRKAVYVDSTLRVTYWQTDIETALMY